MLLGRVVVSQLRWNGSTLQVSGYTIPAILSLSCAEKMGPCLPISGQVFSQYSIQDEMVMRVLRLWVAMNPEKMVLLT